MPILLTPDTFSLFEVAAQEVIPRLSPARRLEVLAAGFGFNTYNSLLAKLGKEGRFLAEIDDERAAERLSKLQPNYQYSFDLIETFADDVLSHHLRKKIKLPPIGDGYYGDGERATHVYPKELAREFSLRGYRETWQLAEMADRTKPFLPPLPLPAEFGLSSFASFEIYRSWRPGKVKKPLTDGTIGVVILGKDGSPCGFARWHWWAHPERFSGADFSIGFVRDDVWQGFLFDLRPSGPLPENIKIMTDWRLVPPDPWIDEIRSIGAEWYGGPNIFGKSIYADEDAE